jgi:iron complex outermembrane receptor protein
MRNITRHFLVSASVLACAAAALPAAAQETTEEAAEEIIVTATKRAASILDVPFSVNAQTQADIQRSGANNLEDIARNVAGLTIQNLGPGQSQVSVRGVSAGQIVRDQPGVKEQVGVYLDESVISLSLFTPDLDLFDLDRVETLRGPQGTLFGSGSVGGTIRYITNQPNTDGVEGTVEGNVNLVDGDDFGGHLKGAVNLPLGEQFAVRAVGYYTQYGGFIDARREGGGVTEDINDGMRYGGRIALLFQPTDDISITPRVIYQKIETDGFNRQELFNLYANPYTTVAGGRPPVQLGKREQHLLLKEAFEDETWIADLTASISLGAVDLTSVTSYTNRDILVSRDASALTHSVSIDLGLATAVTAIPSNLRDTTDVESWTQEVRLASLGDGPFQWLIGGFYSDTDRFYRQRLPTPGYDPFVDAVFGAGTSAAVANGFPLNSPYNADLPYNLKQFALFGEATYDITDRIHFTAGARYYDYKEERRFTSGGLFSNGDDQVDKTKSDGITPRFLLSFETSDEVTLNLQASKGFRLGGVNDPLNIPLCTPEDAAIFGGFQDYDDETLWNYEGGVKVGSGAVRFSGAVFYNDIKNLQVTLDAGSCSSRVVFNVPKAHTIGLEAELSAEVTDGLTLGLSGNYVSAKFDSTVRDGTGNVIGGIREGNRLPTVPQWQFSANVNHDFPVGDGVDGFVNASIQLIGDRFTQPSDQENNPRTFVHGLPFGGAPAGASTTVDLKLPSYELVNLSTGLEFDNGLSLTAYVTNLFDRNPLLSFDRERGGRARLGFNVGQPRTFGLTARKTF